MPSKQTFTLRCHKSLLIFSKDRKRMFYTEMKEFDFFLNNSSRMSNLSPRGRAGPWARPEAFSLCLDVSRRGSLIRLQSFSNCLFKGLIAALTYRATSSDVIGTLGLVAALPTCSTSWRPKLWVSSPVMQVFTCSEFETLIPESQNVAVKLELKYFIRCHNIGWRIFPVEIYQSNEVK